MENSAYLALLIPSFLAGVLTVLAPCVISLLPVILGGNLGQKNPWRPLVIAGSLGVSGLIFTLLLKATTALLGIPQEVWKWLSGLLVLLFGVVMIWPALWDKFAHALKLDKSKSFLNVARKDGPWGAVLLGAALGPVFSTCSPTYALILAIVLPASFVAGLLNLLAYTLGLVLILLAIGYGGQAVSRRFRFAANPNGWFKKLLGVLLVLTGLMVLTGFDKTFEAWIIEQGYFGPIDIEESLIDSVELP